MNLRRLALLAALAVSAVTVSTGCNVGPTDEEEESVGVDESDDQGLDEDAEEELGNSADAISATDRRATCIQNNGHWDAGSKTCMSCDGWGFCDGGG